MIFGEGATASGTPASVLVRTGAAKVPEANPKFTERIACHSMCFPGALPRSGRPNSRTERYGAPSRALRGTLPCAVFFGLGNVPDTSRSSRNAPSNSLIVSRSIANRHTGRCKWLVPETERVTDSGDSFDKLRNRREGRNWW